jgi:hypothetical protein
VNHEDTIASDWIIRLTAGTRRAARVSWTGMLEIALVLLSIVCFVLLDRYVVGCEKI